MQIEIDRLRSGQAGKDEFLKALASDSLLIRMNAVECLGNHAFGRDVEFANAVAKLITGTTADVLVLGSTRQKHYVAAQVLRRPAAYPEGMFESVCGALSVDDIDRSKALAAELNGPEQGL